MFGGKFKEQPGIPKNETSNRLEKKQERDPEKIWRNLVAKPEISNAIKRTLSAVNVEKFLEIMTSPRAIEADWFCICGYLSKEQAEQYIVAAGDHDECRQELTDLALKISIEIKPSLEQLVENDIINKKNSGIDNVFNSLRKLHRCRVENFRNIPMYITTLGDYFVEITGALIAADLIELADEEKVDDRIKNKINQFIDSWRISFSINAGKDFTGNYFYRERLVLRKSFESKENIRMLNKVINYNGEYSEENRLRIENEIKTNLEALRGDSVYKKIPPITLNEENPQIILMKDFSDEGSYCGNPCYGCMNFRREKIGHPEIRKNKQGRSAYIFEANRGVVNFNINPATGDLCFIGTGTSFDQIIPKDQHLTLKNYILKKLREYLESKEPDKEDLFVYSKEELVVREEEIEKRKEEEKKTQVAEIKTENEDVRLEENEHFETVDANSEVDWQYIPYELTEKNVSQDKNNKEEMFVLPKNFRVAVMNRISGAKPSDIFSALGRMMGKHKKQEGGHRFFYSERTGMTMPIPLHSRKSKDSMALGTVLNSLNVWGYHPVELAMELGLEIPKRIIGNLQGDKDAAKKIEAESPIYFGKHQN